MIYLLSKKENYNWLRYVLDEFIRIEKAEFEFSIVDSIDLAGKSVANTLSYVPNKQDSDLYCSSHKVDISSKEIEIIDKNIYVLKESVSKEGRHLLNYDLLWNAFYFLSRSYEYYQEKQGKKTLSYSFNANNSRRNLWEIPVVNHLFQKFKELLQNKFPNCSFKAESLPKLELSHDLDYLYKTPNLRIKQSLFNFYNGIKKGSLLKIKKATQFLIKNSNYWNFDYWLEFDKKSEISSTFYIYSFYKSQGLKAKLIDPSYRISDNEDLQKVLLNLHSEGIDIGLHGSYNSANSFELLKNEKAVLESSLNIDISKTRQHWLNYSETKTPDSHNKLFKEDSTLGWNDIMGFRSGIASQYQPYDHLNEKAFQYFVTPLVIMDSNIYDYGFGTEEKTINKGVSILNMVKNLGNSHISISWHPRTRTKEYNWHLGYETLVNNWKIAI